MKEVLDLLEMARLQGGQIDLSDNPIIGYCEEDHAPATIATLDPATTLPTSPKPA
jgi:hypothetical protein